MVTDLVSPTSPRQPGIPPLTARPLRIALIAGEASGDLLGASLAASLRSLHPAVELVGVCGPAMRTAGVVSWYDCSKLAVMGLAEVLRHLPRLLRFRRELRQRLLAWQPDAVIGIDAPDFNLGLERWLKERGIATVHYVSPSIWAWREQRAAKIGHSAERVLCLFPMEPPIYARHRVRAEFVGHPLASQFPLRPEAAAARRDLSLPEGRHWLALLPGSRLGEIERLSADFLHAAALLRRRHADFSVLVPMANAATRAAFERRLAAVTLAAPAQPGEEQASQSELMRLRDELFLVDGQSHTVMQAADLLLLASGTAALEGLLAKRPMVVGYRIAALTHWLVKTLGMLKVSHYSLPNVLAGEELVPERMQQDCTPRRLAEALCAWWEQPARREALLPRFEAIHRQLLPPRPEAAAQAVLELLAARAGGS